MIRTRIRPLLAAVSLLPAILGAGGREIRNPDRRVPNRRPAAASRAPAPWLGRYEENLGQFPGPARFLFRGAGFDAGVTGTGAVFSCRRGRRASLLRMEVEGAVPGPGLRAGEEAPGRTNYFLGRDPAKWVRGARGFGGLERRGIRPGVDLSWRTEGDAPAYGFVLAPGVDPAGLVLRFEGASSLRVEEDGSLAVAVPGGVLRHGRPAAWQEGSGPRTSVPVAFEILGPGRVGFRAGRRDASRPLVIDPLISYASYFGTDPGLEIQRLRADASGALLMAGITTTTNLVPGDLNVDTVVGRDAFVASLAPGGARLDFATFLGGYKDESGIALSSDGTGSVWLAGRTGSEDLPVKNAFQATKTKDYDAGFLARITGSGSDIAFSTYLGGSVSHVGGDGSLSSSILTVVSLPGGGAMVSGTTAAGDFPLLNPFQPTYSGGGNDAFIAGFSDSGTLLHSSYIGGSEVDAFRCSAACPDGSAVFGGFTSSVDFPQVAAIAGTSNSGTHGILLKIPAGGGTVAWSQYFGSYDDYGPKSVAVLSSGNVVVGGLGAPNHPLVNPLGTTPGSYVSVFNSGVDALVFSTFLPNGADLDDVGADPEGAVYVSGATQGIAGPLVAPIQPTLLGVQDAFLLKIAPDFSAYSFSTYLGGSGREYAPVHLAVEDGSHAWVGGLTDSQNLQLKGPIQTQPQNNFLVRVTLSPGAPSGLTAEPVVGPRAKLRWFDESDDETGFEIERRKGTGAFAPAGTVGADVSTFQDTLLLPVSTYDYRVRAVRPDGPTDWSNVAPVSTLDVPPYSPQALSATGFSRSAIRLDWFPGSTNETGYQVLRRTRGGSPFLRSVLPKGTDTYKDFGLQPARDYGYVVKALNDLGDADSAEAWGTTLGTILPTTLAGSLKDSPTPGSDQVKVAGTFAFADDAPDLALDPILDGVEFRLGGEEAPFLDFRISAASSAWTLRKGTYTWRSPAKALPRVALSINPSKGTFRFKATRFDFSAPPSSPVVVRLSSGSDAGLVSEAWTESKPGSGKFRR